MFGSDILEVAIGLVFVYLLMSILCSTVTEAIARWLALRARTLKDGILKLLNYDEKLNDDILKHPLFQGISPKDPQNPRTFENLKDPEKEHWWDLITIGKWHIFRKSNYGPSELPPSTFSQIIFDTLIEAGETPDDVYKAIAAPERKEDDKYDDEGRSKSLIDASRQVVVNLEKNIDSLIAKAAVQEAAEKAKAAELKKAAELGNVALKTKVAELAKTAVQTTTEKINNVSTMKTLRLFLTTAKTKENNWDGVIAEFKTSLEKWFDDSMQRVTGWYKRKTQLIVFSLALVICLFLNVDSFAIANSLYTDPSLREAVVANAEAYVAKAASTNTTVDSTNATLEATYNKVHDELTGLNLPIGWTTDTTDPRHPGTPWGWLLKIGGILVTAFAVSLGAPFWFDLLNKLVNLRAAGKKTAKTE